MSVVIALVATLRGGPVGWAFAGLVLLAGAFDGSTADLEVTTHGVRYRRWRRWRFLPFAEITSVSWPVFGRTNLQLKRPLRPWGRLYFHVPALSLEGQRAFLEKIEAGIRAAR